MQFDNLIPILFEEESLNELAWFKDSPDAGDPSCICSYCGFVIPEEDIPWRIFQQSDNPEGKLIEARLHSACFQECFKKLTK